MNYITKQQFQANPEKFGGEINEEPSMTVEGEYMEMKDILDFVKRGGNMPQTDVQYFRPDDIQQINSLYKQSLDLTDIDALRQKTKIMQTKINEAHERKKKEETELQKAMEQNKKDYPNPDEPKTE